LVVAPVVVLVLQKKVLFATGTPAAAGEHQSATFCSRNLGLVDLIGGNLLG
jgi:hypothetical protein